MAVMHRVMMRVGVAVRMMHQVMMARMGMTVRMMMGSRESGRGQQGRGQGDNGQGYEKATH
jgi:hypothetical protein